MNSRRSRSSRPLTKSLACWPKSAKFEAGLVYLPERAPCLADLEAALFSFPGSRHDEQVDSSSGAGRRLRSLLPQSLLWKRRWGLPEWPGRPSHYRVGNCARTRFWKGGEAGSPAPATMTARCAGANACRTGSREACRRKSSKSQPCLMSSATSGCRSRWSPQSVREGRREAQASASTASTVMTNSKLGYMYPC